MSATPGPQVAHVLEDRTVILEDGLKRYIVCVASWGSEIDCEYPMETSRSRRGIGSAAICKRRVKRCTPLFAKLDALARVAISKAGATS